jgi:hypothetical protein
VDNKSYNQILLFQWQKIFIEQNTTTTERDDEQYLIHHDVLLSYKIITSWKKINDNDDGIFIVFNIQHYIKTATTIY